MGQSPFALCSWWWAHTLHHFLTKSALFKKNSTHSWAKGWLWIWITRTTEMSTRLRRGDLWRQSTVQLRYYRITKDYSSSSYMMTAPAIKVLARYHMANLNFFKGKVTFSQTRKKSSTFTAPNITRRPILFSSFHRQFSICCLSIQLCQNQPTVNLQNKLWIVSKLKISRSEHLFVLKPELQKLKLNQLLITQIASRSKSSSILKGTDKNLGHLIWHFDWMSCF